MENKYENTSSPRRDKFKEEFNKSVNVSGKENYGHYNESERNIEESDGKRLYNNSTDMSYEKLTSTVDVSNVYDTIHSDDVDNKEQVANKEKHYAYKTDLESDNLKCSTGIERRMITSAGNLASNSNTCTDITYETLASTNDTSNEYDKIRSGIEDNALDRHSSEENTKVYRNMILNATDLNLTESNPDTAESSEVWAKTESPKALTSEYESLTLQNLSHQDEYQTINGVDREKIRTAFTSRKTRLICIFLLIAVLIITTVIITLVFTVFKNENVEKCVSFIAPENGFVEDQNEKGSLVLGTKITISCRKGYFIDGNETVVCYHNRTWSESPTCEIRDCGIPSGIMNGYINDLENTTVNSTFTVKCDEGYIKVGIETVLCDMNGTWSELPNCRPVSCGIPQVLDNETVMVYNETTFGATANFRCIEGFSLTSASFSTCLSNGSWTKIPSCFKTIADVTIGDLTVDPKLKFRKNSGYEIPYLHFECTENPEADRSADQNFYSTYWFVESTLLKAYERQSNFKTIDESDLMDSGYQLGVTIQCGIRVSTSITGFQTEMKSSASFFAGVEIEPLVINMNKSDTATITLRPTVPFGCYAAVDATPTGRCFHTVNMHYPDLSNTQCETDITSFGSVPMVNSLQEQCGVEIEGFYPYQARASSTLVMDSVSMDITSPYFSDSDPTEYKLSLKTANRGTHAIWKNVYLSQVQLNIITQNKYKKKMCYAHVDSHIKTSDGRAYENNDYSGSFIMYEHDTGIQVQMKTVACNNNRAYCACAVAVRAGGDVFLINLCGGLRFIDMTSCKDGGALVVQKYSELSYQVQTNIGTLVKINILSGNYKYLMNIDIYMAPKDYSRIKGLCGTFDGDTNNDFHDRSGTKVGRTPFLQAWKISNLDINLLEPSCSVDVGTWTESGQLLYCTCNCFNDGQCGTVEETATCSPSQYVCTVSLTITSNLCQDYETRCSIQSTARRSSFYTDPEAEMKRRAALAERPHKFVGKRQTDESELITEEMARIYCTNNVTTETIEKNQHLLGGFNITQAIDECTWNVHTGQDLGWIATHKQAADSAIEIGYKRDANYTLYHTEELKEFKMQLCPFNCNGNGVCQENGTCTCDSLYFGPDCGTKKSNRPTIEDIEGGGFCDQRYGSECRCFSVQTEALAESFQCKMVRQKKMLSGDTLTIGSDSTEGRYRNLYNGECCFAEGRRKRSSDTETGVLHYLYDISISNDGTNFGPVTIVYVFDSLCLNRNTDSDENVQFTVKADTCLIDGYCYEQNDVNISNVCFKCDPSNSQYNWTQGCMSPPNDEEGSLTASNIAGIVVGVIVGIMIVTTIVFIGVKKGCKKGSVNASLGFSSGPVVSREPSRMSFNVDNLTYGQT